MSDVILDAIQEVRRLNKQADIYVTELVYILDGRLRHVSSTRALARLKQELKKFNIHTGRWAD